jgi:tight adherence protein B
MGAQQFLIPIFAMLAVGGVFYVLVYPLLSGETKAKKRQAAFTSRSAKTIIDRSGDAAKRRKQVADSLKELDARAKTKKLTLESRLARAGLSWSKTGFYIRSAILGLSLATVAFFLSGSSVIIVGTAIAGGIGLPRWIMGYLTRRRIRKFLVELPSAIDIIVRGIKAGIPLGDCLRNIAAEASEPVKSEFRAIVEAQSVGLTVGEAVERLAERVPAPEANFFAIVISIQQKAGGNLAETLSNLSSVIRDRKKMQKKVKAMSSEAKASAGIIGSLPFIVGGLVTLTSPDYMKLLFITSLGHIVMAVCAFWMACGIFIMKKMINFDM